MLVQRQALMDPSPKLWGLITHFNPAGYRGKLRHLQLASQSARRQGLPLIIVELAFGNSAFVVPNDWAEVVVHLNTNTVLWHKERLLNIALGYLPRSCTKIAWIDGDVIFTNDQWVPAACEALDEYPIVQLFETAVYLPPDHDGSALKGSHPSIESGQVPVHSQSSAAFAARKCRTIEEISATLENYSSAHPGFAWAGHRTLFEKVGFYDRFIVGSGDTVMMWAMYVNSATSSLFPLPHGALFDDVSRWTCRFNRLVRGRVACVPGRALHLWHGRLSDRQYGSRLSLLIDHDFDPQVDIGLDSSGCWVWTTDKPGLHRGVTEYFWSRREDNATDAS